MALDSGKFTAEQVRLPDFLERQTIRDFGPGDYGLFEEGAFIVKEDGTCWLDGKADIQDTQLYGEKYIKVICLYEGLVVDLASGYNHSDHFLRLGCGPVPTREKEMSEYQYLDGELLPVIALITNEEELLILDSAYKEATGQHYLSKRNRKLAKSLIQEVKVKSPSSQAMTDK